MEKHMEQIKNFFLRPMPMRDHDEEHRAATQLELFFDLVSVIAIASAAATLHHSISHGDGLQYLNGFCFIFMAIIMAWIQYSWFASAYDNRDGYFVIFTAIIMLGYLIFASGVEHMITTFDFGPGLIGWIIIRIGQISLWLRAQKYTKGKENHYARNMAWILFFNQTLWVLLYVLIEPGTNLFLLLGSLIFVCEVILPTRLVYNGGFTFHPGHMVERYGLLNIIVLGEIMLSLSIAAGYFYEHGIGLSILFDLLAGFFIVFLLWWHYFLDNEKLPENNIRDLAIWGYGHVIIFGAGTFIGAAMAVYFDVRTDVAHIDIGFAIHLVAIGIAIYLVGIWLVRERFRFHRKQKHMLLISAAFILVLGYMGMHIWTMALVLLVAFLYKVATLDEE